MTEISESQMGVVPSEHWSDALAKIITGKTQDKHLTSPLQKLMMKLMMSLQNQELLTTTSQSQLQELKDTL